MTRRRAAMAMGFGLGAVLQMLSASPGLAAVTGPQWTVTAVSRPTNFAPGDHSGDDSYLVTVTNTGGAATDGSPVVITDELPEGGPLSFSAAAPTGEDELAAANNKPASTRITCIEGSCTYTGTVIPGQTLLLSFPVGTSSCGSCSATNVVTVFGGGAPAASMRTPTTISSEKAKFGISPGGTTTALSSLQAGAHADLTASIAFNTTNNVGSLAGDPKNVVYDLPPGFAGDLVDTPSCPAPVFREKTCQINTQIGIVRVSYLLNLSGTPQEEDRIFPVYNLTPDPGEVAKLGFVVGGVAYEEGAVHVRSDDYGLETVFEDAPQSTAELNSASLTVWGVPASPIHDPLRNNNGTFGSPDAIAVAPYFTNPTSCGSAPLSARFEVTSWQEPGAPAVEPPEPLLFGPLVGCDRVGFAPSVLIEPSTFSASAPTGLDVTTTIPQTFGNAEGVSSSHLKKAVITLPEGMTVNPSAGAGLGACTSAQLAEEAAQYVPGKGCPNESKLGTFKAQSPALSEEATGSVFLATPYENRFGSLIALYIVARIPNRGIVVKAAGEVNANPITGQLVTTFDDLPQLPVGSFRFSFRQGQTSPLVTPPTCGVYQTNAQFASWSAREGATLTPLIPPFAISSECPPGGQQSFDPQMIAGSATPNAGEYTQLEIHITRKDDEQEITRFSAQLPPGLTANLTGIPFCSDRSIEAAKLKTGFQEEGEPSCPPASEIGQTVASAGVGSVLAQAPGKLYLAGPYNGAPLSVAAITRAKVGPFDLGTVVVRQALRVDPLTGVVTVDGASSDPIPRIIKGIVVHLREIHVFVNRRAFVENPTNCAPFVFSARIKSSGAEATVDDPYRVTACQALKLTPKFKVTTSGKTSRVNGASLKLVVTRATGPGSGQANFSKAKIDLPKQLPSRLHTLQKACLAAQFNVNPAGCPPQSVVGHVRVITPILPVPLEGPAYFVSHGGEAFPSLVFVLQGYGITLDVVSTTFISKTGVTSGTLKAVPDQPFSLFELTLPEGPYSALGAATNLCKIKKLTVPTAFTAQNGIEIHQQTPIAVTGCPKKTKHAAKARSGGHRRGRRRH
jgi:hypothetical protein